jgi:ferrochelatase
MNKHKDIKTGVLIVNLGTPDAPTRGAVYRYLREFLTDRRVITYPWLARQLLVQGIIAPFRSGPSSKIYKMVWTEEGSPLKIYGENLVEKVQERLGSDVMVKLAMRYQKPSIESAMREMLTADLDRIVIFPLFPQYASATTGSIFEEVMDVLKKEWVIPEISWIQSYPVDQDMIQVFANNGREKYNLDDYDHVIFSFHGIPQSQVKSADPGNYCQANGICCQKWHAKNKNCYSAQCHATGFAIAEELNLDRDKFTISYQSRLGPEAWLQPYTSKVLEERYKNGDRKILVFCPAFVADCLETSIEIGVEYKEEFMELGGEQLDLVPSLNDKDEWADTIVRMLKDREPSLR